LALVLLAALIALGLVGGTALLIVYGLVTRDRRRGKRASFVGLGLSITAAVLSTPFWIVVLSGRDTHGQRLDYGESFPIVAVVLVEALAIGVSLFAVVRHVRRGTSS
jgi:uncharacterized membrane-anchored protein